MARDIEGLREQLRKHGPWWLREPEVVADSVLYAIAAVFADVERVTELLHERTFLETADGAWLDAHGRERGIYRLTGELDGDYRLRLRSIEDVVTKPAILAGVESVLLIPGARLEEHAIDGFYLSPEGSGLVNGFLDNTGLWADTRAFTVFIPAQLPDSNGTAFLVGDGEPGPESFLVENTGDGISPTDPGMFADQAEPTAGDIYRRIWEQIDRLRAAGSTFHVQLE